MGVIATTRPSAAATAAAMPESDRVLIETAEHLIDERYRLRRHEVAAAARLKSGALVTGLHVEASQGRASVCAEAGILSAAAAADDPIELMIALVRLPDGGIYTIEPCGVCAEILTDICPEATVWVGDGDEPRAVSVRQLLPFRHARIARLPEDERK